MCASVRISSLTAEYCEKASMLEKKFLVTAWSETQLKEIINNPTYKYVLALEEEKLLGVGGATCFAEDSAEIFTVAVDESSRNKGIGALIVSNLIEFCRSNGATSIFLEVEEGNTSAIKLYLKSGFTEVGKRKGFYRGKDAIVMKKMLT